MGTRVSISQAFENSTLPMGSCCLVEFDTSAPAIGSPRHDQYGRCGKGSWEIPIIDARQNAPAGTSQRGDLSCVMFAHSVSDMPTMRTSRAFTPMPVRSKNRTPTTTAKSVKAVRTRVVRSLVGTGVFYLKIYY